MGHHPGSKASRSYFRFSRVRVVAQCATTFQRNDQIRPKAIAALVSGPTGGGRQSLQKMALPWSQCRPSWKKEPVIYRVAPTPAAASLSSIRSSSPAYATVPPTTYLRASFVALSNANTTTETTTAALRRH